MSKTKPSKAKKPDRPAAVLTLPVDFGGVSIGDATARIGIKVSRDRLNIEAADEALCGRRLSGRVLLGGNMDDPAQTYLFDDIEHEITGTFDVKRYSVGPKEISCGLTFSVKEIDLAELGHFAKQSGRLIVESIAVIPDDSESTDEVDGDDDGDDEDESFATRTPLIDKVPRESVLPEDAVTKIKVGILRDVRDGDGKIILAAALEMIGYTDNYGDVFVMNPHRIDLEAEDFAELTTEPAKRDHGAWRKLGIDKLKGGVTAKDKEKLAVANILTLGDLQDRMQTHGTWWARDIKGVGEQGQMRIEDAFNTLVAANA